MPNSPQPISITPDWKVELSQSVTTIDELLGSLDLNRTSSALANRQHSDFALRVPRPFIARMQPITPMTHCYLQVLPVKAELTSVAGYSQDPLDEAATTPLRALYINMPTDCF